MAVTPLFGVPMDGGAQSFDGVSQSAPQAQSMSPEGPKHHSGFQNVLGFLGDFLLSRLHMGTPYHDARENEKLNAARLADEQSGDGSYTRTGALNPAWAAQLQNRAIDNNRLAASVASTTELRDARLAKEKADEKARQRKIIGNFAVGLALRPEEERANTYEQMLPYFKKTYPDVAPELTDTYNPTVLDGIADSSVEGAAQRAQRLTQVRDTNTNERGVKSNQIKETGQQLTHQDRQDSIAHADSRAAARNATSRSNTQARINAGPVVSTTTSSGDIVMPDGTTKKYSGTKTTTKGRAGAAPASRWSNFVKH